MNSSEFTVAQINKHSNPRGIVPDDSNIKCKRHGMNEIKCEGPCGQYRPRTAYTGQRRKSGNSKVTTLKTTTWFGSSFADRLLLHSGVVSASSGS